jgi:eukaryotic-like serine/threonine-protein kinase
VERGALHAQFRAQGYSAVLLDHAWEGGSGLEWLRTLAGRPGFAPVIFLAPGRQPDIEAQARSAGAFAVIAADKIHHAGLIDQVRAAHSLQNAQQADWRGSPDAREQQTFGGAYVKGYRRAQKLASGSVSDLFLAESLAAGQLVVLKVSRDMRREDGIDQSFERFLQEYEIVRSIRHPNVVRVLDLGVTDNYAYLVMEYFPQGDLRRRMLPPPPLRQTLDYSLAIAGALGAIHAAGILHRDLKPGNVLMRDDGSIALIDFGLAKHHALTLEITDKGLIFGTPHYMSPEQGHGKPIDARTDLYALGVMLYEMLTGAKPFDADNPMAVIYKHAKLPVPRLPETLAVMQPIVDRLLAKSPQDRYPDAASVIVALKEVRATLPAAELAA